jgi:hypothetical protein
MVAENDIPAYDCRLEAVHSLVVIEKCFAKHKWLDYQDASQSLFGDMMKYDVVWTTMLGEVAVYKVPMNS